MTTPLATGLLMYGQAGTYDAVDMRRVIEATSGRRTGVVRRCDFRAGSGLQVIFPAWLGLVQCADGTTAVIGDRTDRTVALPAGGASARTDYIWVDVFPDQAQWQMLRLTQSETASRTGLLLGTITVPANASAASGFTFNPVSITAGGAGGVLARGFASGATVSDPRSPTTFAAGFAVVSVGPVQVYPGRIYRLVGFTPQALYSANAAGGVQLRTAFARDSAQLGVATADFYTAINQGLSITCLWTGTLAAGAPVFSWRMWTIPTGTFRPDNTGQGVTLTVEDCGPTHVTNWT